MPSTYDSTIVAAFRDNADAQAAAQELQSQGINRDHIYITSGQTNQTVTSGTGKTQRQSGVTGWFKSIFGDEHESDRTGYEKALGDGHVLLRVDAREDQLDSVADVLDRHSPIDVHQEAGTSQGYAAATAAGAGAAGTAGVGRAPAESRSVPVVEEELKVGKRRVLRGGVRVYSRTVEEPVEERVNLQEERVRVERRPVNRAVDANDLNSGKEQVIEVEEFAEEPVVSKNARVVEEVRVGKDASQRTETVKDSVRHTEVDVEQIPGSAGKTAGEGARSYDDTDFRRDFDANYAAGGQAYDAYAPSYRYGYDMASDPRYKGRSFNEVEPDLRREYSSRYPDSTWERMKNSVRYGWDKVTRRK